MKIKDYIDRGGELSIRFQRAITDYPSSVAIFRFTGSYTYCVSSGGRAFFEGPSFSKAWKFFEQYADPYRNAGVAYTMAQNIDTEWEIEMGDDESHKYLIGIVKKKGWCTKTDPNLYKTIH